ncbi:MAG: hypothetical protein EOP48_20645 [Sphingobacteriales bacterium]|nr:MAG: hypothetical protein EOP48_20645 [Sphingobacteriales bacterium]
MDKWLKEVSSSLEEAVNKAESGNIPLANIYMLAPLLYAEKHNMRNEALLKEMIDETEAQVAEDYSHNEKSREQYKFQYVSSYLFCFVVAGKLEEMQYDRVMEYVCERMALFTDDYGD